MRVQGHFVPYARAAQILQECFGVQVSAGSIVTFVKACHEQLAEAHEQLKALVKQAKVLHHDETGVRVNKQTQWVLVACTSQLTRLSCSSTTWTRSHEADRHSLLLQRLADA